MYFDVDFDEGESILALLKLLVDDHARARDQYYRECFEGETLLFREFFGELMGLTPDDEVLAPFPPEPRPAVELVEMMDRFAEKLFDAANGMCIDDRRWSKFIPVMSKGSLEDDDESGPLREKLELLVAAQLTRHAQGSLARCLQLGTLTIHARPAPQVARFLTRLSRSYITGLDAECVILCRAVLENALQERFDIAQVSMPDRMVARIDTARLAGWLDTDGAHAARDIWYRGNKAVHNDPDAVKNVFGTIELTANVLRQLYADVK